MSTADASTKKRKRPAAARLIQPSAAAARRSGRPAPFHMSMAGSPCARDLYWRYLGLKALDAGRSADRTFHLSRTLHAAARGWGPEAYLYQPAKILDIATRVEVVGTADFVARDADGSAEFVAMFHSSRAGRWVRAQSSAHGPHVAEANLIAWALGAKTFAVVYVHEETGAIVEYQRDVLLDEAKQVLARFAVAARAFKAGDAPECRYLARGVPPELTPCCDDEIVGDELVSELATAAG